MKRFQLPKLAKFLVAVTVVAVGATVWLCSDVPDATGSLASGPDNSPPTSALRERVRWGCALPDGTRLAVDGHSFIDADINYIKLRRAMPQFAAQLPKGVQKLNARAGWHIEAAVTAHEGTAAVVTGDWRFRPEASDKEVIAEVGTRPMGVRFLVHEDCQLTDIRIERGVKTATMSKIGESLGVLSFACPAKDEPEAVVTELVGNAVAQMSYSLTDPSGTTLRASFRGLPAALEGERALNRMTVLPRVGIKTINAGTASWFATIDGAFDSRDEHHAARTSAKHHVIAAAPDPAWKLRDIEFSDLTQLELVQNGDDQEVLAEIDKYRNKSLDEMFALLDQMEANGVPVHRQTGALAYWLLGHQDKIPWYVDRLRRGDFPSQRRKAHATSGLAQTQLPEAAEAIRSLFKDKMTDAQVRAQSFVSMGLEIRNPTPEAVDDLLAIAKSTTEHPGAEHMASLLAGAMANEQRDRNPEIHAKVIQHLEMRLQTDHDLALSNALKGAMNSAEAKLLPLIEVHLKSSEPLPHGAAWRALHGMPYPALEEAYAGLKASVAGGSEAIRLYAALADAAELGKQLPGPGVTEGALAVFAENGYSVQSAQLDMAIVKLLGPVWKAKPGDPVLLKAFAAKFAAATAGKHTALIQALVSLVGLETLIQG